MIVFNKKTALVLTSRAAAAMVLVVSVAAAQAGSYDDFFTRIIRDDAPGIGAEFGLIQS